MPHAVSTHSPGRVVFTIASMLGGGAERHVSYLAAGLAARGWQVTLAILDEGPNLERVERAGVPVARVPRSSNLDARLVPRLAALLREARPQVVHGWMPMMNTLGAAAARLAGVPFVGGEQACGEGYPDGWRLRAETFALRHWAAGVVANSEGGRQWVRDRLGGDVPVWVVRNGLPITEIEAAPPATREEMGVAPDAEVILYVGRLDAQKNVAALFAGIPRVLAARPRAVLVLCGEGPERARWEEHVRREGLEGRVVFAGYVRKVWGWMKAADAFVFPSWFEGQPNALMEAIACGCPVVASDIPAHREFLHAGVARLVPPAGADELAAAVEDTLADRPAALARAARARALIRGFRMEMMVQSHERVYAELAARPAARGTRVRPAVAPTLR